MTASPVEPPPEAFNFAAHLLQANAGRPAKAAFIDDVGVVTFGELDERARRFAAAQEKAPSARSALILMQDGADWPVAFLGAMLTGVVPVAVNTLTADDLAYMLEHSRAQVALVSGAIRPALKPRSQKRITKSTPSSCHARLSRSSPRKSSSRISSAAWRRAEGCAHPG